MFSAKGMPDGPLESLPPRLALFSSTPSKGVAFRFSPLLFHGAGLVSGHTFAKIFVLIVIWKNRGEHR